MTKKKMAVETIEQEVKDCYAKAGHQPPNTSCVCGWRPDPRDNTDVTLSAGGIYKPCKHGREPKTCVECHLDRQDARKLEVRSVSSTGGEKGTKLARFDLIPAGPLTELAMHFGRGAQKYEDRNWERGYEWSKSFAAMMRHAMAFWGGEDIDPETGTPHIIAVAWHALALNEFMNKHPEFDDRSK